MKASELISKVVFRAMQVREESYCNTAADEATEKCDEEKAIAPKELEYLYVVDYSQFYQMSMFDAAAQACKEFGDERLTEIVYLLCQNSWNESGQWAQEVIKESQKS